MDKKAKNESDDPPLRLPNELLQLNSAGSAIDLVDELHRMAYRRELSRMDHVLRSGVSKSGRP